MANAVTETVRRGELAEITAWESLWDAAPPAVREALGLSRVRDGSMAALRAPKAGWWFLNRLLGVGLDGPARRDAVDAMIDGLAEGGGPHGASLVPDVTPREVPSWLEARGLRRTTTLAKLERDARTLPAIEARDDVQIAGAADAARFAATVIEGFGVSPVMGEWFAALAGRDGWRLYLALDGDEAVGTGALHVQGDVAWLGVGSVVKSHRGRGLHRPLMERRMADAAALGCRWLVTETNAPAEGVPAPSFATMKRCGFEVAYERANYVVGG